MPRTLSSPIFKRFILYGLILLGLTLSSAVIFVVATDEATLATDEAFPEPVVVDPEKRPSFVFPENLRTYDLQVNRFIDRFARVSLQGSYSEFRLMLSQKRPPMLPERFESNFNALKQIRILRLEKLPPMPQPDAPLYLMYAEYELKDFAVKKGERTKQVMAAILREDGEYRLGPLPSGAVEKLTAYRAEQARQAGEPKPPAPTSQSAVNPSSESPTKATANRAARIGP